MWLFTKFGFFSIVQDNQRLNKVIVRARKKEDLVALINSTSLKKQGIKIYTTNTSDYLYRIFIKRFQLNEIMTFLSEEVDYSNFKNKVAETKGQRDKINILNQIWNLMFNYQLSNKKENFIDNFNWFYKDKYAHSKSNFRVTSDN